MTNTRAAAVATGAGATTRRRSTHGAAIIGAEGSGAITTITRAGVNTVGAATNAASTGAWNDETSLNTAAVVAGVARKTSARATARKVGASLAATKIIDVVKSTRAATITGAAYPIDGGWTAQ